MGKMKAYYQDKIEQEMRDNEIDQEIAELRFQEMYDDLTEEEKASLYEGNDEINMTSVGDYVDSFYQDYCREQAEKDLANNGKNKIKKGA